MGHAMTQRLARRENAEARRWLDSVETRTDQIIESLPGQTNEAVIEIRQQARTLGRCGWRVEIACDAEILKRASMRRGQGVKDVDRRGVQASVEDYAKANDVTPKTIYLNVQLHNTFFNSHNTVRIKAVDILASKDFFLAALEADDPQKALTKFAQAKQANPDFSPSDARRLLKANDAPALTDVIPPLFDNPDIKAAWEQFQIAALDLKWRAPRLGALISSYLEELEYEISLPPQTIREAIDDLIRQGFDEVDMIASRLKRDRVHVQVWMRRLCEMGEYELFEKERAPGARGQARTGYRPKG